MKISEAIKIANRFGYKVINEDVYTSSFKLNNRIKEYLDNDKFIIVLLMGMYGRQVDFEKNGRKTVLKNFRGFNQTDAGYLSPLAEKVEQGKVLTPAEIKFVKQRLKTYRNTQWTEVLQELGYVEVRPLPGRKQELYFNEDEFKEATGVDLEAAVPSGEQDFVAQALALAQEDAGILDDEDLSAAKKLAAQLYHLGLVSPQDAANKINDEF